MSLPWTLDKPTSPGVFVLHCEEWLREKTRLVTVTANDEGTELFVVGAKPCEHSGWNPCSLAGFNSLAQRKIWWLRLERPDGVRQGKPSSSGGGAADPGGPDARVDDGA